MTITNSFKTLFANDVKLQYDQMESMLRKASRVVPNVKGEVYKFQKLASIAATTRSARNAALTVTTPNHTAPSATLSAQFAKLYLDFEDAARVVKEDAMRMDYAKISAGALKRAEDSLLVTALDGSTQIALDATTGATWDKVARAYKTLNAKNVPRDGRFWIISPYQEEELIKLAQLSNHDYVSKAVVESGSLPTILGAPVIVSTLLNTELFGADTARKCYLVHKDSIGLAIGQDVTTNMMETENAQHAIVSWMLMGAALIDTDGTVEMRCKEV